MKLKTYVKLALQNIRSRKKKTIANVSILTLCLLVLFVVNIFIYSIQEYLNHSLYNTPDSCRIYFQVGGFDDGKSVDDLYAEFKHDNRVVDIVYWGNSSGDMACGVRLENSQELFKIEQENSYASLNSFSNKISDYLINSDITNLKEDEIIIPRYFYPDGNIDDSTLHIDDYLNGENYIGKIFTIKQDTVNYYDARQVLNTTEYKLKVVATYDNTACESNGKTIFVSPDFMKKYNENEYIKLEEPEELDEEAIYCAESLDTYVLYTHTKEQADEIVKDYPEFRFQRGMTFKDFNGIFDFISLIGNSIASILLVCSIINILITIHKDIKSRTNDFGLLKAVGYRNKNLYWILLWEMLILVIITLLSTIVITFILKTIGNILIIKLCPVYIRSFRFMLALQILPKIIAVGIIAPFTGFLFGVIKITYIDIIKALKTAE